MRVTLLVYVEREGDKQFDKSIFQIADALSSAGHQTSIMPVHNDVQKMVVGLKRRKPDLVFNLMEQFGSGKLGLAESTAMLDLLEIPYTGCGGGELYLQDDKALAKQLLACENVHTPDFAVFSPHADLDAGGNLRMPLFVEPLRMDASFGSRASRSLVATAADLMKQVAFIHEQFNDCALCEQYIEGRVFYVGVLGNAQPQAFLPVEIDPAGMPSGALHFMDNKPKVAELETDLRARLQEVALTAYRALRVRDYGSVELRLTNTGEIYVIEVNGNCYLEKESEYATNAAEAGIAYEVLIGKIVDLALERHRAARVGPRRLKSSRQNEKRARVASSG